MRVLVVNVGSSSVKLRLVDGTDVIGSRDLDAGADADLSAALEEGLSGWDPPEAVGHRIVHGGPGLRGPALLDDDVVARLTDLTPLAPLHQPRGLEGVALLRRLLPDKPQVACFDTAFFADLPVAARTYAVPGEWNARFGLRRFGFHGLSHSYAARTAASFLGGKVARRIVTCHLGAGASLSAIADGVAVDTTMGFTPLEGVVMSTRSGSVDPGMLLWLQEHGGLDAAEVSDGLEHRSGLKGLAGTGDMRAVLERAAAGDEAAALARDVYIHRLRAGIAAMTAATEGLDVLVFTGGVGENSAEVRARACAGLAHLGVSLAEDVNASAVPDARVDTGEGVAVMTIASREDLEIARQVRDRLGRGAG